jgi:hypothetical protein
MKPRPARMVALFSVFADSAITRAIIESYIVQGSGSLALDQETLAILVRAQRAAGVTEHVRVRLELKARAGGRTRINLRELPAMDGRDGVDDRSWVLGGGARSGQAAVLGREFIGYNNGVPLLAAVGSRRRSWT